MVKNSWSLFLIIVVTSGIRSAYNREFPHPPNPAPKGDNEDDEPNEAFHQEFARDELDCEDKNNNCNGWANSGECCINPIYMITNCRTSCQICHDNDTHLQCGYWARRGECIDNPDYMLTNCLSSCTIYDPDSVNTAETTDETEAIINRAQEIAKKIKQALKISF